MTSPARYSASSLVRFATDLLARAGLDESMAADVGAILVDGDLLGHTTHGLQLLGPYLREIEAGVLSVAYTESGPGDGPPVVLLHGFPYDIHAFEAVRHTLAAAACRVLTPYLRGYGPTRFLGLGLLERHGSDRRERQSQGQL